jgi:phosphatidylinositol alpha 1,6-mannosyltransferase
VVAPAAGGPIDLVVHGYNGFLWVPGSETSLIGGVDELVRNPVKRERLGSQARQSVKDRTWHAVMDELEGHYLSVFCGLVFAYRGMS